MNYLFALLAGLLLLSCRQKTGGQQEDELYSRHLQRQVKLTIIHTPIPDDKNQLNLLLLNDGQDMKTMRMQELVDSLYSAGAIKPLLVVGITAGDRLQEFGVAGKPDYENRGARADHYSSFINNELYPYAKKKSGVRKFDAVAIAGWSLGGLSAFDVAWNNTAKIDRVGVFSGSFWWRDKDSRDSSYSDDKNRIVINTIRASRRKAGPQYWFFAGGREETGDRDKDGKIDVIDDTEDVLNALAQKNLVSKNNTPFIIDPNGQHDTETWRRALPAFLVWAFGK